MIWLLDLLRKPSAFRTDPWRYFWSRFGHAYVVGGATVFFLGVPVWAVLIGYAIWESAQMIWFGGEADDALEDWGDVALVATAAHLAAPVLILVQAAFMLSGFITRYQARHALTEGGMP